MVKYCIAYGCKELQRRGSDTQFHRFPFSRPEILKKWLHAIRREKWSPSSSSRICSKHFTNDCYQVRPGAPTKLLKESAVPSVFNFSSHLQKNKRIIRRGLVFESPTVLMKSVAEDSNKDGVPGAGFECVWLPGTPASAPSEVKTEAGVSDEDRAACTSLENASCPQAEAGNMIEVENIKKEPEDFSPADVLEETLCESETVLEIKEEVVETEELVEVKQELSTEESSIDLGGAGGRESKGTRSDLFVFSADTSSVRGTVSQQTGEQHKPCSKCTSEPCSCFQPASSSQFSPVCPRSSASAPSKPSAQKIVSDVLRKFVDGSQSKISPPSSSSHVGSQGKETDSNKKKGPQSSKESVNPFSNVTNSQPSKKTESDFMISLAEYLFCQQMTSQQIKDIKLNVRRLKRKCQKSGRTGFKDICKMDNDPDVRSLKKHVSTMRFNMLKEKIPCPPRRYIWTPEEKIEFLTLYQRSPRCYMVLNLAFAMPKRKNLNALINSLVFQPGINPNIFKCLGVALKDMSPNDALCCLAFDVMTVERHLTYNSTLDYIEGYEDFGDERTLNFTNGVLVFMLCGLRKKWKMPVAYFLCHDISAQRLQILIRKVLVACDDAGANVMSLVCDMSACNMKALKSMGASFSSPYIFFRGRIIFTIYDPPSLLKYTRNLLQHCFVKMMTSDDETHVASWEHLRVLFELDKVASVRLVPKLTKVHVCPVGKAKFDVKIAAETLSHSVAKAVSTLVEKGELPAAGQATSALIEELDSLFDSLIGEDREPEAGKTYRCMVTKDSPHMQYWSKVYNRIKQWQFVDVETGQVFRPSCKGGWLATLRAVLYIWSALQRHGLSHMKPRSLSLDALRNTFCDIRSVYGRNLLNSTQFINGLKLSIIRDTSSEADNVYLMSELKNHFFDQIGREPSPLPVVEDGF